MKKTLLIIALVSLTTSVALAQTGAVRGGSRNRVPVLTVKDFNLKALEGRVVLMAFWKVPDPANDTMVPWLNRLQAEYGEAGLTVVAVNVNERSSAGSDAAAVMHDQIQIVLDPTGRLASHHRLGGVPGGIFFDRAGGRRGDFLGFSHGGMDTLTAQVDSLVAEVYEIEKD